MKEYNEDFKNDSLSFPNRGIPESEKTVAYHRQWAKAMFSAHKNDKGAIPGTYRKTIELLRAYGRGRQPASLYLKEKSGTTGTGSTASIDGGTANSLKYDRDGRGNIDTNIISVAPRVKSMIKAYLKNIQEDIIVDTIDAVSGAAQEDKKWEMYTRSKDKKFIEQYQKNAGIQTDTPEFMPETVDELEMYSEAGGFKLIEASFIEDLVKYTMQISGYDDELENDLYDDAMDIGIICTKTKLDPEDLKYRDKYVDIAELAVQHSRYNDFRDIEWVGHVEYYTISSLRKCAPHISETELRDIAMMYTGRNNNPTTFDAYDKVVDFGSWGYDQFTVSVFEAEWRDEETEQAVFYDNKNGKTSQLPVTEETTKGLSSRKRYVKSNLEKRREASWIIGTEHIFDYGMVNMQDRPANNKTASNYHIRALSDAPMIAQLVPVLDNLQTSWLRFQDARANAVKDGYAIDLSKLQAIGDGEKTYKVAEVLRMWKERGLLMYKNSITGRYEGGKTTPIERLPATLLDEVNEFVQAWDHALKMMEDLTGINALILGATPDPNSPVGTQKLSVASSASAIRPLGLAMNAVKRESAESFMRRFTLACKTREDIVHSYEGVIGKKAIEKLLKAGRTMIEYGMFFHPRPTETEKAALLEAAQMSMQNRREGRPGIDLSTFTFIQEQLYAGVNLKRLRIMMAYKEKEIAEKDQEQKKELINLQADRNDRSAQTAAQGDMQKQDMKIRGDMAVNGQQQQASLMNELVKQDKSVADAAARRLGLKSDANPYTEAPQQSSEPLSQGE